MPRNTSSFPSPPPSPPPSASTSSYSASLDSGKIISPANSIINPLQQTLGYGRLRHLNRMKREKFLDEAHPPLCVRWDGETPSGFIQILESCGNDRIRQGPIGKPPAGRFDPRAPHFDVILVDMTNYTSVEPKTREYVGPNSGKNEIPVYYRVLKDLTELPMESLAGRPGWLFLWVGPTENLAEARRLMGIWGFRKVECIGWMRTDGVWETVQEDDDDEYCPDILHRVVEWCIVGLKGSAKRTFDSHLIHCNIDTDVMVSDGPQAPISSLLSHIIENFSLGQRRLHLFARPGDERPGWVTVGRDFEKTTFDCRRYIRTWDEAGRQGWLTPYDAEIEYFRPKTPPLQVRRRVRGGKNNRRGGAGKPYRPRDAEPPRFPHPGQDKEPTWRVMSLHMRRNYALYSSLDRNDVQFSRDGGATICAPPPLRERPMNDLRVFQLSRNIHRKQRPRNAPFIVEQLVPLRRERQAQLLRTLRDQVTVAQPGQPLICIQEPSPPPSAPGLSSHERSLLSQFGSSQSQQQQQNSQQSQQPLPTVVGAGRPIPQPDVWNIQSLPPLSVSLRPRLLTEEPKPPYNRSMSTSGQFGPPANGMLAPVGQPGPLANKSLSGEQLRPSRSRSISTGGQLRPPTEPLADRRPLSGAQLGPARNPMPVGGLPANGVLTPVEQPGPLANNLFSNEQLRPAHNSSFSTGGQFGPPANGMLAPAEQLGPLANKSLSGEQLRPSHNRSISAGGQFRPPTGPSTDRRSFSGESLGALHSRSMSTGGPPISGGQHESADIRPFPFAGRLRPDNNAPPINSPVSFMQQLPPTHGLPLSTGMQFKPPANSLSSAGEKFRPPADSRLPASELLGHMSRQSDPALAPATARSYSQLRVSHNSVPELSRHPHSLVPGITNGPNQSISTNITTGYRQNQQTVETAVSNTTNGNNMSFAGSHQSQSSITYSPPTSLSGSNPYQAAVNRMGQPAPLNPSASYYTPPQDLLVPSIRNGDRQFFPQTLGRGFNDPTLLLGNQGPNQPQPHPASNGNRNFPAVLHEYIRDQNGNFIVDCPEVPQFRVEQRQQIRAQHDPGYAQHQAQIQSQLAMAQALMSINKSRGGAPIVAGASMARAMNLVAMAEARGLPNQKYY